MSKKMKILFTVSVILNVLLLGLAGGAAFKHWRDHTSGRVEAGMSPEARNVVARTMQKAFRDGREDMREARKVKKKIRDILAAEEFDAEAFDQKAEQLHDIMSAMGQKRIAVTKELAAQLSQEDRQVLAERFSKGFRGHDKKGRKDRPHAFLKDQERPAPIRDMQGPDLPEDMPPQP